MTTHDETFSELLAMTQAASKLLAAMDRQHGSSPFSMNVIDARDELRRLVASPPEERDRAEHVLT